MEDAMKWLEEEKEVGDLALFLDFDGTLAPIVERPADARPVSGVVPVVEAISKSIPVAVVSGRGLDDVRHRLGARGIYYAGSHGMEIRDPKGDVHEFEALRGLLPELDRQEEWLRRIFADVDGVEVERKRYGIAVHYRRNPQARQMVESRLEEAARRGGTRLKTTSGKMVREVQPDVNLDKGTALRYIGERIDPEGRRRPMYIGDDRTDEDAFAVIGDKGVCILVGDEPRETLAHYGLRNPAAVCTFLEKLAARLDEK